MRAMNDNILVEEITPDSAIVSPHTERSPVKKGLVKFTCPDNDDGITQPVPKEGDTVYYRAAEGLLLPDIELIAIPVKAVIAIEG